MSILESAVISRHCGKSLRDVYADQCDLLQCKKNSYLLKTLSNVADDFHSLTELDLSLNFVGRVGIRAVLEVIAITPNVTRLCLADNWLNNDAVREIVNVIKDSGLHYLDLSRNPISHTAGKLLSEYAGRNPAIHSIILEGTLINPALSRIIQAKATSNHLNYLKSIDVDVEFEVAALLPQQADQLSTWGGSNFLSLLHDASIQLDAVARYPAFAALVQAAKSKRQGLEALESLAASVPGLVQRASPVKNPPHKISITPSPPVVTVKPVVKPAVNDPFNSNLQPTGYLATVFEVMEDEDRVDDFFALNILRELATDRNQLSPIASRLAANSVSPAKLDDRLDTESTAGASSAADSADLDGQSTNNSSPQKFVAFSDRVEYRKPTTPPPGLSLLWTCAEKRVQSGTNLLSVRKLCRLGGVKVPEIKAQWYGMGLIFMLVKREKMGGNDNWGALSSVLNVISGEKM